MDNKIIDFINLLTNKTLKGECIWEDDNQGYNRLVLNNGSVIFDYSFDDMIGNYHYKIQLFDTTELFASYYVDYEDNYDDQLFTALDKLRIAIANRKEKVINDKIQNLLNDLL